MLTMEFEELAELIFGALKPKLESSQGLFIFAKERAKFEGWLKVELCDSLFKYFKDVAPEKDRVDVTFENWAIELKTINTSYRHENVKNKTRPLPQNVQGVIKDIEKLKHLNYKNKAVLFVVFPLPQCHKKWSIQIQRITAQLAIIKDSEFRFKGNIPAVIYLGLI